RRDGRGSARPSARPAAGDTRARSCAARSSVSTHSAFARSAIRASLAPPEHAALRARDAAEVVDPAHVTATHGCSPLRGVIVAFVAQSPLDLFGNCAGKDQTVGVDVAAHQVARTPAFAPPVRLHSKEQRSRGSLLVA